MLFRISMQIKIDPIDLCTSASNPNSLFVQNFVNLVPLKRQYAIDRLYPITGDRALISRKPTCHSAVSVSMLSKVHILGR